MNVCIMDSPELKELYDSLKETGESYESIKNLVNVWQLRKFNRNKEFDFTELPTKQDIENLLKERDVPNIDSAFVQEYSQEMKDILANAPRDEQGRLLAPNGKLSNLTERQYAQVRTKAFKEWFGDWENDPANASKVVDENGEPLVVYHYTNENSLTEFKTDFDNYFSKIKGGTKSAIFFTTNKNKILDRKNSIAVFLNLKTPFEYHGTKESMHQKGTDYTTLVNQAEAQQGAIFTGLDDNKLKNQTVLVAYNPNQIKSAEENIGTFSNESNRIDYFTDSITVEDNSASLTEEQQQFILNAIPNLDTFLEDSYKEYTTKESSKENPYNQLFVEILDTLKLNNIPVSIAKDFKLNAIAQIQQTHLKEAVIKVNPKRLFDYIAQFDREDMKMHTSEVILHELIHSITADVLNMHPSWSKLRGFDEAQTTFNAEIDRLFKQASQALKDEDWYGLTNRKEFIAEALSNPKFQERLSQIKSEKETSIFQRIVNSIRDLFHKLFINKGVNIENSVFDDVLRVSQNYINYAKTGINTNFDDFGFKNKIDKFEDKQWAVTSDNNYEVSSEGDKRFSAKDATFKPNTIIDGVDVGGKTIEYVYQNVIKKSGKGQAPSKDSRLYIPSVSSYTGNITSDANTIFVFGSNPEGRHGAGAAKIAREQFGAIYGQGEGLQGNAYALPTKDLRVKKNNSLRSISPEQIIESIKKLYETAKQNPNKQFKVAYRNTDKASLNGYTGLEMIDMFLKAGSIPSNIVFSKEWVDTGKFNLSDEAKEDFSYTEGYLPLWQEWAKQNPELIEELREKSKGKVLTDKFANTRVSQARALADILNSTNVEQIPIPDNLIETPETVAQDINKEEQSNYVKRIVRAEIIEQYNEELKDFGSLERRQDRINLILRFIRNQKGSLFKKHKGYFENRLKDENLTEEERLQYERHLKNLDADDLFISEINNIISRLKSSFSPESLSRLLSRKILEKTVPNFNELSEEEQNEKIENDYNYRVQEYSKIQKHWDSLLEDVKATLRLVDGIIIDYVNPNESDTDNNNEETGSTKDNWMYQARKVDQRESLSKKVKVIISNIPILDNNGRQEYDDLGFARFMDSEEVASTLFYELSNSRSCEHFWKKFNNLPNKKPWTKIIVDTINKENNYEVKSQFYQNFRKESVPYWSQVWTKKGIIKTKKINRGKNTQLLDDWSDNIESGNTLTNNSIYGENGKPNVENASKNRDTLNNLVVDFKKRGNKIGTTDNLNTLVDLIKSVGIEISTDELTRSVNGNVKKTENIFNALLTIFKGVLEGKTILATEVNSLLVYDNIVEKFNKQYNILAGTIDFDLKSSELQSFRELGDTYQSVSAPSYIGTLINNLRNAEDEGEFKEFFEKEFGQYSQFVDKQTNRIKNDWLDILYNNKEERANLERKVVLHANRKEFNQQTPEEYLLGMLAEFEATNNNKYAYYALPLLSDADSEEFIKFVRYVDGSVKDESGNPISYKTIINQKLAQVIFDEYERILVVKNRLKNKAETITTFDSKGAEFNYLPELNDITINIDGEIAGRGENRTVFDTITLLVSEDKDCIPVITKVVEQIMERNAAEFVQDSLKITSAETIAIKLNKDKAAVDKYLTNFFYNHTLATINMIQLLTTDLAYYENTVTFYKRFKEVYAATLKLDTTAKFKGDDGIVEGTKTQKVLILKDNIVKAPSYDNIKSILDGRVEAGAITSEQRDELLKAYKKVNVADAQGYRSLKSYRKLMVMAGRWNKKLEKSYQRLKNGKFDYEDFSCIYNTIKPFCYSQRPVDSQVSYNNEKTGETVEYGKLKVPIQIKDSEAVLLAMYTTLVSPLNKSERLVNLNKFMDDKNIDIVVFESGVKVGGQGIVDLNNVEDKDVYDKLIEKVFPNGVKNPFIVHSISTEDFGIQVETPDHLVDVEQLIGSQIKKLIQGDIDVNNTGTVTFRINEGIKGREKQMDKKQMLTHLNELLSADIINSFEKLREEFASLDKVAETLQRELKGNSRYTKDLIVACSLVETTDQIGNVIREFGLPLNDATQFSRIENLLTSLFKNNIIKQKMRGGSPIQFSCYGVSNDLHIEMTGEGTERRIKWVDCYLPAYTKEFYKYYLTTDKDGNQFIDINKVPEELKRLIGYRVPTEARYSMLPLRIKGFLPSSEGSKIMLPAEITTIAGSDFDRQSMLK